MAGGRDGIAAEQQRLVSKLRRLGPAGLRRFERSMRPLRGMRGPVS